MRIRDPGVLKPFACVLQPKQTALPQRMAFWCLQQDCFKLHAGADGWSLARNMINVGWCDKKGTQTTAVSFGSLCVVGLNMAPSTILHTYLRAPTIIRTHLRAPCDFAILRRPGANLILVQRTLQRVPNQHSRLVNCGRGAHCFSFLSLSLSLSLSPVRSHRSQIIYLDVVF